jgi:CheY-like chemotaxis protein
LQPFQRQSKRVLVVEDNLDTVHGLTLLVRMMGHEVEFAINGYAALDIARKLRPEFVFLDLGLPGLDGYEVARRLKAEMGSDVRIIALTGYGSEDAREQSAGAGCEQHLIKPADPRFIESLLG